MLLNDESNQIALVVGRIQPNIKGNLVSGWKRIIEKIAVLRIDVEKFIEYPAAVISEAFEFGEMECFSRSKMFNRMLDKLGLI